ncbi:MAG: cobalamin biosynthesis protein CbiX, partial [Phycisphaerae bacterium]|nr:cobalamin biosynthesis protein CbiX [Phycisphaerae bacterium]
AKREAERLRARGEFAEVLNAYMEEPPLIADWDKLTGVPNVIVVPFFISDGLHSFEDIPRLLGIPFSLGGSRSGNGNPHHLRGRHLFYANAIGTDVRFADVIVEQALNASSIAHGS